MLNVSDEVLHTARILIVDDELAGVELLRDVLHFDNYSNIRSLTDPRGVVAQLIEFQPDIILLDLNMPYLDGYQVLDLVNSFVRGEDYLPIMVLTADHTVEAKQRALSNGALDFLYKPYEAVEVCLRVRNLLRLRFQYLQLQNQKGALERQIQERTQELESYQLELKEAQLETIFRLARAAEHHDEDTAQHTQRVALLSSLIGETMSMPAHEVTMLRHAAPLHDVGKIGIPDSILLKPGKFTDIERKVMQTHCKIGADLLSGGRSDLLRMAEQIAMCHHERWDGSGYPRGLQRDEIELPARILAVADVFDALTHERPYKKAWPIEEAKSEIARLSGCHFDPEVVRAFLRVVEEGLLEAAPPVAALNDESLLAEAKAAMLESIRQA